VCSIIIFYSLAGYTTQLILVHVFLFAPEMQWRRKLRYLVEILRLRLHQKIQENLCIKLKFFKNFLEKYHHFEVKLFWISGIFPICSGCFLPADTADKKHVKLQKFSLAISLQCSKSQAIGLWTSSLQDQDETWNLWDQGLDTQKWVSRWVSRLHHWFRIYRLN